MIVNLASKEYSKCIEKYLQPTDRFLTVTFCEESKGKLVTKGTYAKMARGEMVRFLSDRGAESAEVMKEFTGLGFHYDETLSSDHDYWFLRK